MLFILAAAASSSPAQNTNTVTLAWDPSPEPDVAGYILYYGPASTVYTNSIDVGNAVTGRVSGLTVSATYFFVVTAYNTAGLQSDPSNEIQYTVPQPGAGPSISAIGNQTVAQGSPAVVIPFTVNEAGLSAASLVVAGTSSNPGLVPDINIVSGGISSNRTLTVLPLLNGLGATTITLRVSDGVGGSASTTFTLTVAPVNHPPTISGLSNVLTGVNTPVTVPFAVNDLETPVGDLIVSAFSSNPILAPNISMTLGGSGSQRTLTLTPSPDAFGTALITLRVNDGGAVNNVAMQSFTWQVASGNGPPPLRILPAGNSVTLSWFAASASFQLEAADALSPLAWNAVEEPPQFVQNQNTVSVAVSPRSRFFRLRKI